MLARLFGVPTLTPEELERLRHQEPVAIYDCNTPGVWASGHIPGARNVDPADYTPADLPADPATPLVFYCSGPLCGAAPYAARRALKLGRPRVYVMGAGIVGWREEGRPVEAGSA